MSKKMARIIPSFTMTALWIWLWGCITASYALPEDSKEPLFVQADSADINQSQHHGIYVGNVAVDQGSTHIRAAKAITENDKHNQLIKAIIQGDATNQAHYWTLQTKNKPELHAYADMMIYYPKQRQIVLKGHASVIQDRNKITADIIHYDIQTQYVSTKFNGEQTTISIQQESNNALEFPT